MDFLQESGAVTTGHIVYKAGTHGTAYIDKRRFRNMGAVKLTKLIYKVGENAIRQGLTFEPYVTEVGIIGPAYGAIAFALPMAACLENSFPNIRFFPANTELSIDHTGNRIHVISEKDMPDYKGKKFIAFEDIINNGTTVREVKIVFERDADGEIIAVLCFVDRGGQTNESLGNISQYFPFQRVSMEQSEAKECSQCIQGIHIRTDIGKGERWVKLFGQPPYPPDKDFSAFWK